MATVGLVLIIIVIACFVQRRRQQNASHHVTKVKKTTSGKNKKLTKQDIQQSFKGVKRVSQISDLLICFEHSTISIKWTQCKAQVSTQSCFNVNLTSIKYKKTLNSRGPITSCFNMVFVSTQRFFNVNLKSIMYKKR